ncbi:unnamed protein product [Arabidopsis halleri]
MEEASIDFGCGEVNTALYNVKGLMLARSVNASGAAIFLEGTGRE